MKHNLDTISQKAQDVRLTQSEKFDMLQNLRAYADNTTPQPVRSPYHMFWLKRAVSYATVFVLVVGTGATSFAAEQSVPGDTLYAIKTGLNEAIIRVLPLPSSTRAKVEVGLIDRRMTELEKLIVEDKDTPENVDVVLKKIGEHKTEFDSHVVAIDQGSQAQADEVHDELDTVVSAHIDVIEKITEGEDEEEVADQQAPENAAVPQDSQQMDIQLAAQPDPSAATMMMKAVPQSDMLFHAALPAEEPVDPLVQEITDLTRTTAATDTPVITEQTAETRKRLRARILERAQRELNIKLDASLFDDAESGTGEEN